MEGSLGMKHFFRFFAAAACTVLLLALCACAPDGTSSPVSSSATEGVSSESTAQSIPAPESASGEGAQALSLLPADAANIQPDAVPEFLTADQQELYRAAYYLYYHFDVSSGFAFDTIDENSPFIVGDTGRSYYQDTGFANYSAFRTALDCVFTSNFADSLIDKYQCEVPQFQIKSIFSVCSLSNLFFRFHTTTLTEACSNELKQHHL